MIAIASLLVVLVMSIVVVRIAAEALTLTGISREAARFQARSAWTGTGFTTAEAEHVVGHPVRRRIISGLMFLRGVGLVTATSTLMLSFVTVEQREEGLMRFGALLLGMVILWLIARSDWINVRTSRAIAWALKRYTDIDTRDYAGLLHLGGEYAVMELKVRPDHWMAHRTLEQLRLPDEGVLVLGVAHDDGTYHGAPRGDQEVAAGDVLVLYGRSSELSELSRRRATPAGERDRQRAVGKEKRVEQSERSATEEARRKRV